jgi:amino acid transporter
MNILLNAVLVSLAISVLISLINIGSTVALNAIESIIISALMSSYMITIGCVLLKRIKGEPLPAHRWSLGRYGMAINIASMLFLCPLFVFAFFPACHARGREHDELELYNVRRDYSVGNRVLLGLGQEAVYTTGVIGEERAV